MKFLADENTHALIVRWLRGEGHDVVWATESMCGQPDHALLDFARQERRIILTADLDFGELIYQQHLASDGLVLVRLEQLPVQDRILRLQAVWSLIEANPTGKFIVITDRKVRIRALPTHPES